jgi:transcriptional regulator with XRE-family HTH domain
VHIFAHFGAKVYLNSTDFPMKKKVITPSLHSATTKQTNQLTVQSPQKVQPLLVEIGSRLRHARLSKGLLIKDLAERVGVSISLISKYENNKLLPPLTVLHSVVTELGTNIGALFEPNWTGVDYVARANGRPRISAAGDGESAGVTLERLVPHGKGHLLQGNIHIVAPGGGSMGPMLHDGDEVGYVLEGRLKLSIDDTIYELEPGDSFAFPSNLSHTYSNPGEIVTRIIWINTPPTF